MRRNFAVGKSLGQATIRRGEDALSSTIFRAKPMDVAKSRTTRISSKSLAKLHPRSGEEVCREFVSGCCLKAMDYLI